ncbi:histidine phosphatase family protein [Cupriavidus plantarum]|uniref:Histidine phosphatase superfamily protein (Branch 1) n=1 Tax=Cupriavidus plantarum TaxID=942865 RepID=A0A316ENW9_9BURK|nr:histidine phosphatase family protein [Cupriavidus plantarum]NYI02316.1 broad specificity phosphatase PhoE [Cupriavidus plantarum]PWK33027.1 histidine phosphatase superfamily protein (branch 1) [Cupriavidus plantarum]RLK31028.1 histidine phosphatase superfamily protein (branch 1) [Cupriavidus plantarum]CAG2146175.1 hypothetical protein LMG26296_03899 [Cupriavidus plantarum]SMR86140.1 Histidine phosphatase superfamily (branch 1) [Cupriavidus plantarum]
MALSFVFARLLPVLLLVAPALGVAQPSVADASLRQPNVLVILRHASAPGLGDPPGFRIDDCRTQRNLDAAGRQQAVDLGAAWRRDGFRPTRVMSSAWCRCQETARLMDVGPVRVEPMLNSFFEAEGAARTAQTERLSRFIDSLDPKGGPYLMVTHQVVISALTGHGARSAGGVAIELPVNGGQRRVRVLD